MKDQLLEMAKDGPAWDRRIETLGVVSSIMLLLGLALENLIKASMSPGIQPSLIERASIVRYGKPKAGTVLGTWRRL